MKALSFDEVERRLRCLYEMDADVSLDPAEQGEVRALETALAAMKERDALAAEVERLRRVEKAAKGLTTQLHAVHRDHRYYAVWQLAQQHMGQYQGPQYGREQDALDAALAAREALLTGEGE